MKRDLAALVDRTFDLVVVGGGIFGACAAWDAAQRGLSVALVERGDFAGVTSANSFKIVHGGIRYLQHGDLYRIRQSSRERRVLLTIAPHLVKPLPIAVPTYGRGMKGKTVLRFGMGVYDLLTADRNLGIRDPARRIPGGRALGRDETLALFSGLEGDGLTGCALFHDAQIHNPPRLVFAFVQQAVAAGATAANYIEATGLLRSGRHISGITARDVFSGDELEIRAKVVLNAAGPYAEKFIRRATQAPIKPTGTYSRDACFVVSRPLLQGPEALAVQGRTHDPDAKFSRGQRHLFLAPWRDYTLIGTWHKVHAGDADRFTVTDGELEAFIDEFNAGYPGLDLSLDDVALWNAGLVPFGENRQDDVHLRYGHRSRLIDHAQTDRLENLLTLIGVRFTTGRFEAARAVDLACRKMGLKRTGSRTHTTRLWGGEIDEVESFVQQAVRSAPAGLPADVIRSLIGNYGSNYSDVLRLADGESALLERVGGHPTILAQVRRAVDEEMAQTLGDVVFRRTDLATGEYPGRVALRQCAELMARDLGWDETRVCREIDQVAGRFPARIVQRIDRDTRRQAGVPYSPSAS